MQSKNLAPSTHPHRKIWALSWPILLANLSSPLLGLVDTALLGHLDTANSLAAAAIGASIYSYVFWGFGFLRQGATGLTAQAYGRSDKTRQQQLLNQTLFLALALGTLLNILSFWLIPLALKVMQINPPLYQLSAEYLEIRFYAAPFMLASFGLIGWLIGRQNTTAVMIIMVFTNILNIVLDVWFIQIKEWGSRGAATASSLAEFSGFLLALFLVYKENFKIKFSQFFSRNAKELVEQNHFLFQRSLLLLICFSVFTAQGAKFSNTIVAANSILFQLVLFSAYFLDAYAHTIESLSGEAEGNKDIKARNFWIKKCAAWNFLTAIFICLLFFILQKPISLAFTSNQEIILLLNEFLPWLFALPLVAAVCYFLDGIFIGLTRVKEMRNSMFISCIIFMLTWFFWGTENNHNLWFAMFLLHLARAVSMGFYFFKAYKN